MHKLTAEYQVEHEKFVAYRNKVLLLMEDLLAQYKINYHKVECRAKDPGRLEEKIVSKNNKYASLREVTDLVGVRVITYFEDEIDKVAEIIEKEFIVDPKNSIDKRHLDFDRFGYRSLHYVVSLNNERQKLIEYVRFTGIQVEVQIRSVLQHAWAEIEHDIGYKGAFTIPHSLKRSFYRVAALLETADMEFVQIRDNQKEYELSLEKEIKDHPEKVEINLSSLEHFVLNNTLVQQLDKSIADKFNWTLLNDVLGEILLATLNFLHIETIAELSSLLNAKQSDVVAFASAWVAKESFGGTVRKGISIFYLAYVLIGEKNEADQAREFFSQVLGRKSEKDEERAKSVFTVYSELKQTS